MKYYYVTKYKMELKRKGILYFFEVLLLIEWYKKLVQPRLIANIRFVNMCVRDYYISIQY